MGNDPQGAAAFADGISDVHGILHMNPNMDPQIVAREYAQDLEIALSSGEAEFYGLVSTASEALGLVAMSKDLGDMIDAFLYADASAARRTERGWGGSAISTLNHCGFSRRFDSAGWG